MDKPYVDDRPESRCERAARIFVEMKSVPLMAVALATSLIGYLVYSKINRVRQPNIILDVTSNEHSQVRRRTP